MGAEEIDWVVEAGHGVVSAREAEAAGVSRHAVQWALRQGWWKSLRRGVYTSTQRWEQSSAEERHVLQLLAHQRVNPRSIACSTSAAIGLGLPTPAGPPPRLLVTTARPATGRPAKRGVRAGAVRRSTRLGKVEIWQAANGLRITSPPRTVLDCARIWTPPWGLAIADAALFAKLATPAGLSEALDNDPPAKGQESARWVVEHVRPQVESPLESLARATIVRAGLPEPTPQVRVRTRLGPYRVDLLDERHRLITEADGRLKYQTPDDLWQEKRREDALREEGYLFLRFAMADATHPTPWLVRYQRRLADAGYR